MFAWLGKLDPFSTYHIFNFSGASSENHLNGGWGTGECDKETNYPGK